MDKVDQRGGFVSKNCEFSCLYNVSEWDTILMENCSFAIYLKC